MSTIRIAVFALHIAVTLPALAEDRPRVAAVNGPLAYFAERIADDAVDVVLPVPDGLDPADWRPSDQAILLLQEADLILSNGAGYSGWLKTVAIPRYRLIDTSAPFQERYMPLEGDTTHAHGPEGTHSHGGFASTTWLDFGLAADQAGVAAEALKTLAPDRASEVDERLSVLRADLAELDREARRLGEVAGGRGLIASHPVYQYFARAYGMQIASMHWEPGVTPDAAEWDAFDALRAQTAASVMLWEAEPTAETRQELASRSVMVVVFDPAGGRRDADFLSIMRGNLANLATALEAQ